VAKRAPLMPAGRWSRFRGAAESPAPDAGDASAFTPEVDDRTVEFAANQLLARYGVVFRRLIERERLPVPWRDLVRVYRHRELQGEVRGGRFVQRFAGEQYALPEAVDLMRRLRRMSNAPRVHARDRLARAEGSAASDEPATRHGSRSADRESERPPLEVAATDPLNLDGILTPEARVPAQTRRRVLVA
jgi:ATP-dependent Lhr-like helicase